MDKISLKIKFLIPLVVIIIILIVFLNFLYSFLKEKEAFSISSDEVSSFRFIQKDLVNNQVRLLTLVNDRISGNKKIQTAFFDGDKKRLIALSENELEGLNKNLGIEQIVYLNNEGEIISSTPADITFEAEKKSKNLLFNSFDPKKSSSSYRIAFTSLKEINFQFLTPWYVNNKLVGYIEIWTKCCSFFQPLEKALSTEALLVCPKEIFFDSNEDGEVLCLNNTNKTILKNSDYVLLNNLPFPATENFIKSLNYGVNKLSNNAIYLFSYVQKNRQYRCTLFNFYFDENLTLPVLLISVNENYSSDCFLYKLILYGSIMLGLIIFFFFLRITGKIEGELKERERQLSETNAELESFAYIASHDLKAPLRAIDNLATWIEDDMEEINDNTKQQLDLMKGRIGRMNQLLDSLLEYSRIGRKEAEKFDLNVEKILQKVIYSVDIPESFKVDVDKNMPIFQTYLEPLNQVFSNLIVNAVKHNDKTDGEVRITCGNKGNYYEFSVIDNGPGISKDNYDKIFNLFSTLKSKDEVEGVGMGLAIVKKIVEKYGGEIRVESELNKGASFIFTWPKN